MRNIGLEVMELTNITRCISASLSCSSVVMYRFFHQVDLPTKSRCKIITQSPLINHWIGGVVKLIDEIDIRIRMPLPSSHGTEQVQFIDMMPQRDRTSNLRYLLRHSDPRNRIKRFHRARTCASFFSTWRMTSSSKIPMRWPNAKVCTARIFSVITQLFNQTILRSRRNFNPGSHIIRRKRSHQAYHGRVKTLDFVILHNDNRPRLSRVTISQHSPDLTPPHQRSSSSTNH